MDPYQHTPQGRAKYIVAGGCDEVIPRSRFRAADDNRAMPLCVCVICLEWKRCRFCNQCLGPWYCSTECQAAHWPVHKEECSGQPIRLALLQQGLTE